jgi:polyphosphate kinase 2 (PPK2 family)
MSNKKKMKRKKFDRELEKLQGELVKMQEWVKASGAKICIVFEGRDTAGKGGVIKRITERVSPRVFRVVALAAYNRAGVERVMGFATEEQVEYFLKYVIPVERAIMASGVILIKYWLEVSMENQEERLRARDEDPRKIWKLSPMDLKSYTHWYDYSIARDAMFAASDTAESPWFVVDGNDKRRARLNCITHLLNQIPYEEVPHEPVKFPERQEKGDYQEPDYPYRYVPLKY